MSDPIRDMTVFVQVVESGSLSAAAKNLRLSLPVISRRLAQLEARLGVRLIQRTTRSLSLTDEGETYHARCLRLLEDFTDAEAEIKSRKDTPAGRLRITAPPALARRTLAPLLAAFQETYPNLRIHLDATDKVTNLIEDDYDLAIRFGALPDSTMAARKLADTYRIACATPSYLSAHGTPRSPDDLLHHRCIVFGDPPNPNWHFASGEKFRVRGPITCGDGELAHAMALSGAGIVWKAIWDVGADLAAGHLVRVLPEHASSIVPIHAVYPHSRYLAAKVRHCVDFLTQRMKEQAKAVAP
jgi:DNA-binding transcriptional LysR family regulator